MLMHGTVTVHRSRVSAHLLATDKGGHLERRSGLHLLKSILELLTLGTARGVVDVGLVANNGELVVCVGGSRHVCCLGETGSGAEEGSESVQISDRIVRDAQCWLTLYSVTERRRLETARSG